jgi:phospholipid/cholesterol/gamma-HCH transport system permease protein
MKINNKTLFLEGELNKKTVPTLQKEWLKIAKKELEFIDLQAVHSIDSSGVAFIDIIRREKTGKVEIINIQEQIKGTFETFSSQRLKKINKDAPETIFVQLGDFIYNSRFVITDFLFLTSEIVYWALVGIFTSKGQRKGSFVQQSLLIGVDATGIILLLSIIIGLILALQSAAQLRQFGANVFVADLISISMVREMGPMMTAIIIAGRSGSSIASEIATMKVTEEIDALKMMAINPIRYVVVPKFHAMTVCMPLLVTLSTLIGIVGGLIVAMVYLDLSVVTFVTRVLDTLTPKDVLVGISKSIVFAWVIVIIGSFFGFQVKGGAEGVGKVTTGSVVASIFAVIFLDALFSLIYLG